jgi:RNA polymerase sigma factor (sigma-70 family)
MEKLTKEQEIHLLNECLDCGNCEKLINQYERLVYNTIIKIGKKLSHSFSKQMIEDLSQEIFLELFANDCKRLRAYEQSKGLSLASWIVLIASHTIYDQLSKKKDILSYSSITKMVDIDDCDALNSMIAHDTDNKMDARQHLLMTEACLEKDEINYFEKLVFKYHYFMGLKLDVIAQLTNRKKTTLFSDKTRALQKVKDCIESQHNQNI